MKIIDFEPKGNAIRFYLGDDECNDYWGDDWNDRPYEHNAGIVYDRFIKSTADVFVDLDLAVLVPEDEPFFLLLFAVIVFLFSEAVMRFV